MLKKALFKIKGMSRDLAATAFNSQYAYENKNIRIMTTTEENTLLSLVNEKGTLKADLDIVGFPIGQALLNNEIVLFTTSKEFQDVNITAEEEVIDTINAESTSINDIDDYDRIYKIWTENKELHSKLLYSGNLNFSYKNPIETLPLYENNNIKKIYWVDGKNQPRFINISRDYSNIDNTAFDFIRNIDLNHNITVKTNLLQSGQFNSGVIQYACSYFNMYGQETNIFYESTLLYASRNNRGGSPEEVASNSFDISLSNLDTNFDYVRIYSIFRTSIDATPTVKVIGDFSTKSSIYYTDTNTTGYIIDPTELLYIGGESIIAGTLGQKDNTLFLGDIKINRPYISSEIKNSLKGLNISFYAQESPIKYNPYGTYSYKNQLIYSSADITSFKYNETYRFGVQFQYKTGKWSEVCFLNDNVVNLTPSASIQDDLTYIKLIKAQFTIPQDIQTKLTNLGYVKARGVVVYPNESDRSIIAQGIVSPTVFRKEDRDNNSIYAISSWFFRPMTENTSGTSDSTDANLGTYAEFRDFGSVNKIKDSDYLITREWEIGARNDVNTSYYVDSGFLTFHSPDIEFSNINLNDSNISFRIMGYIKLGGLLSYKSITTSTPTATTRDQGFISSYPSNIVNQRHLIMNSSGGRMLKSGINWAERANKDTNDVYGWLISPWHRSGSITISDEDINASLLKTNKTSNLRYSYGTVFNSTPWIPEHGISSVGIFDSNELELLKISDNVSVYNYYGNYDVLVTSDANNSVGITKWENLYAGKIEESSKGSSNPVSIKFKSSKHAVFKFNNDESDNRVILPNPYGSDFTPYVQLEDSTPPVYSFYGTGPDTTIGDTILWLGELYRPSVANRFGGTSDNVLSTNKWIVAGEAVNLNQTIKYTQGDTYIQRYDCLKTYPYSQEDINNVTEILSFFCETRINIDGRYDRNRGNQNNLAVSPTNFNLLNNVYSQVNNFFSQQYILDEDTKYTEFNNIVTWSKSKTLGEKLDTWTNITLASTLDLDGDKGPIRAIRRFNNSLIAFQDRGISQILYNENMQIASTEGVPIEIANSGKVNGKRYITDKIGCMNKWSICETPSGIWFIDDTTKGIYLFNGQMNNISDKLGFHSWINSRSTGLDIWNPKDFKGFVTYYDKINGDVFFITDTECLAYSEPLNEFTSFYSYEHTPFFINIEDRGIFFKDTEDHNTSVWLHNEGKYNYYFDKYQPFYTTIIANPEAINDKTFSMVEFRADTWKGNTLLQTSFDNLEAWNEYQETSSKLVTKLGVPSNLKRKFRIWRAQIPRDKSNNRDRMRNPWLYIKMGMNNPNENKTLLQDLTVIYF